MKRALFAVTAAAAVLSAAACSVDGKAVVDPAGVDPAASTTTGSDSTGSTTGADLSSPFRITGAPARTTPKVVVTIVEDMACPACRMFEEQFGSTLDDLGRSPDVALDFRVISFLDQMSDDKYSSRAANASYCAWSASPGIDGKWRDFQRKMFADQPAEGGPGLPDSTLQSIARSTLGDVGSSAASCIADGEFAAQVSKNSDATLDEDWFKGTPTVRINGKDFTPTTPDALRDAVAAAGR